MSTLLSVEGPKVGKVAVGVGCWRWQDPAAVVATWIAVARVGSLNLKL